jgi:hypothetical protein
MGKMGKAALSGATTFNWRGVDVDDSKLALPTRVRITFRLVRPTIPLLLVRRPPEQTGQLSKVLIAQLVECVWRNYSGAAHTCHR